MHNRSLRKMKSLLLITLAMASLAAGPALRAQRPQSEEEKEKVRLRIGMTREQQAQIEALWAETDRQAKELGEKQSEYRKQLDSLYDQFDYDRTAASGLRREITILYRKRLLLFADNQERLRKILSKDQFERLCTMVREKREQQHREWENMRKDWQKSHPKPM